MSGHDLNPRHLMLVGGIDVGASELVKARLRIRELEDENNRLKASLAEAVEKNKLDHLTQIPNSIRLLEVFDEVMKKKDPHFCLALIDLDDFKLINDLDESHQVGDGALKHFAHALEEVRRRNDVAFRKSGDEFAVLLYGCSMKGVRSFEARLRHFLRKHRYGTPSGLVYEIQFSLGATMYCAGDTYETMLQRADRKCYEVKYKNKKRK